VRRSGRDPRAKQGLDVSLDGGVTEILFVLGLGLKTDLDWLELELDASDAQASATVLPATRTYLGDLSGGFFVGKRIREIYGLTPDGGASVFDFPEIVGPGAWSSDIGTTWMRWSGRPRSSRPSSTRPRLRTSITRRCSTSWLSSNLDPARFTGGGGLKAVLV
jgi:hypothetical protein